MITATLSIGTASRQAQLPSSWDELTPDQFVYIFAHQPMLGDVPYRVILHLLGATEEEKLYLTPADLFSIYDEYIPWLAHPEDISSWVLSSITLSDGRECFPPYPDFGNMTWEEFVYADQLASSGQWAAVAACLFRPLDTDASEESDTRIPFTSYGATHRLPLFSQLSVPMLRAVEVNYLALRRHVTDRFPHLFFHGSATDSSESVTSWVDIDYQVLGDNFFEEAKLHHASADRVLAHLDHVIHENQNRSKNVKH